LGGWQGRTLQNGDVLPLNPANEIAEAIAEVLRARDAASDGQRSHGPASQQPAVNAQLSVANWFVSADSTTQLGRTLELPTVRGRHFPFLRSSSQQIFWEAEFVVSQNSDRMGYRLEGPELGFVEPAHLSSAPVSRGTIQLPPHGSPIALLADAATTGGYPNIAHVASAELGRLAQAQPGQTIRFREIELAEAQDLLGEQSRRLRQWQRTIALRMSYASR
jgi:antagonist of KipI